MSPTPVHVLRPAFETDCWGDRATRLQYGDESLVSIGDITNLLRNSIRPIRPGRNRFGKAVMGGVS